MAVVKRTSGTKSGKRQVDLLRAEQTSPTVSRRTKAPDVTSTGASAGYAETDEEAMLLAPTDKNSVLGIKELSAVFAAVVTVGTVIVYAQLLKSGVDDVKEGVGKVDKRVEELEKREIRNDATLEEVRRKVEQIPAGKK